MFERLGLGLCTEDAWRERGEECQVMMIAYEKIRESEEALELSSLMQAVSLGSMRKRV